MSMPLMRYLFLLFLPLTAMAQFTIEQPFFSAPATSSSTTPLYYAVGTDTFGAVSNDGTNWVTQTLTNNANGYWFVSYVNSRFLATPLNGVHTAISSDGTNWLDGIVPSSGNWARASYNNGLYFTVKSGSTISATSSDGQTWYQQTMPQSYEWNDTTSGNGLFVAVCGYSTPRDSCYTSYNGTNWFAQQMPASKSWFRICYGGGKFFAVAPQAASTIYSGAAYSNDGTNWVDITVYLGQGNWYGCAYGNGVYHTYPFIASPAAQNAYTSSDFQNWKLITSMADQIISTTFANGKFVTISEGVTPAYVYTSYNGTNWFSHTFTNRVWLSIAGRP